MPYGLGRDFIKLLRQLSPAVFTLYADPIVRQVCLEQGADLFFCKSTETDALLEVVRLQAMLIEGSEHI